MFKKTTPPGQDCQCLEGFMPVLSDDDSRDAEGGHDQVTPGDDEWVSCPATVGDCFPQKSINILEIWKVSCVCGCFGVVASDDEGN